MESGPFRPFGSRRLPNRYEYEAQMLAVQEIWAYPAAMRIGWPLFFLSFTLGVLQAQQRSPWQGEWGSFAGGDMRQGRRLSIHDCDNAACKFSVESRAGGGSAGTASAQSFMIQSETTATATLPGTTAKAVCTLRFERQMNPRPAIIVQAIGDTCTSYYSTDAAIRMEGIYPLRSTTNYIGLHVDQCFLDNSPSRTTICTHPELIKLEQSWQDLADEYPLQPLTAKGQSIYAHAEQLDAMILSACGSDEAAVTCLERRYTEEIAAMQARKDTFLDGTTQRGDPAEGGRLASRIAGRYRHRFQNGDVQGHRLTSTDTLTIRRVGTASIHFDIELNFYNVIAVRSPAERFIERTAASSLTIVQLSTAQTTHWLADSQLFLWPEASNSMTSMEVVGPIAARVEDGTAGDSPIRSA
jgi:hypothetical protein